MYLACKWDSFLLIDTSYLLKTLLKLICLTLHTIMYIQAYTYTHINEQATLQVALVGLINNYYHSNPCTIWWHVCIMYIFNILEMY